MGRWVRTEYGRQDSSRGGGRANMGKYTSILLKLTEDTGATIRPVMTVWTAALEMALISSS